MAAPRTQVENFPLRPAIRARETMNFFQRMPRPDVDFAPQERLDVEKRLPAITASDAGEIELDIGLRIGFGHSIDDYVSDICGQLIRENALIRRLDARHTPLKQARPSLSRFGASSDCQQIETVRQAE